MSVLHKIIFFIATAICLCLLFLPADAEAAASCKCEYRIDNSAGDLNDKFELGVEYSANKANECKESNSIGDLEYYNCQWVEELDLGELRCCEVLETRNEGKTYLWNVPVGSKEICDAVCALGKVIGVDQQCAFNIDVDKKSCEEKKSGALGCCFVEKTGSSDFAYKNVSPIECPKICNSVEAGLLSCAYKDDMFAQECSDWEIKTNLQDMIAGLPSSAEANGAPDGALTKAVIDVPDASGLNQLNSIDARVVIGNAIKTIMGLMGSIALALFMYGGILWMASAGNAERSKKGAQVVVWATLGMFMILASYAITKFIFSTFR